MMHRLRRYDVLRCAQYDAARFTRNDAMFAHYISEATSLASAASLVKRHHLPKANIIQKSLICLVDKLGFWLEQATGIEPALSAWEAEVLPLNYACVYLLIIAQQV